MHTVSRRAALAGLAFFALWPGPAGAQEQTLKIVFPYAAGGSTDAVARMLADHMQKSLGRAVIVENRTRRRWTNRAARRQGSGSGRSNLALYPRKPDHHPSACLSEPRLRSPGRPAADHPSHQVRCGAGRQRQIARPLAARACRLAQGEPGAGDLRLAGRGRGAPFPGGRARSPGKARYAPCPLQGHTGCPSRSDDGPPSDAHHCGRPNSSSTTRPAPSASWRRRVPRVRASCRMSRPCGRAASTSRHRAGTPCTPPQARPRTLPNACERRSSTPYATPRSGPGSRPSASR